MDVYTNTQVKYLCIQISLQLRQSWPNVQKKNMRLASVLLVLPVLCHAWGPITHQIFTCAVVPLSECIDTTNGVFILGSFSPDVFKKNYPIVHSFEYASFQLSYARQLHAQGSVPGFDAVRFSQGYVTHLIEDYVGHHHNGFLNPTEDHPLGMYSYCVFTYLHPMYWHIIATIESCVGQTRCSYMYALHSSVETPVRASTLRSISHVGCKINILSL